MRLDIDKEISKIIDREGGYVYHPNDKGGPTNFGITLSLARKVYGPNYSVESLKDLTKEKAAQIYRKVFYMDPGFDLLPPAMIPQVMDVAVMSGPSRAIKLMQETINTLNLDDLVVDGVLGPLTKRKAWHTNLLWGPFFSDVLSDRRILFYLEIVGKDMTQIAFLKGWVKRALKFKQYRLV